MQELICLSCSNGCRLTIQPETKSLMVVSGNACPRGVAFGHEQLKQRWPGKYISRSPYPFDPPFLIDVLKKWQLDIDRIVPGLFIQGSPERSKNRVVIKGVDGVLYVLEEIDDAAQTHKEETASLLARLKEAGLPVNPYCSGLNGKYVQRGHERPWLLSVFVQGETLNRQTYWKDAWRGDALARFLTQLYDLTGEMTFPERPFSLPDYIESQLSRVHQYHPELKEDLAPLVDFVRQELYPVYHKIPVGFCHGDPHPMNVIWNRDSILCVIDWEFSGPKPVLYDTALIIGCIGSETPESRHAAMVKAFARHMVTRGIFDAELIPLIPPLVVGIRFAWLAEWLRRKDREMITFEVNYMKLILREMNGDF